jgi:hypothetical protein
MTLAAVTASAGYKGVENVYISTWTASGAAGTARASSDPYQFIGCYITQSGGTGEAMYGGCDASDSNGKTANCFFPQAAITGFEKVAAAAGPNSNYYFAWDSTGACTYLSVSSGSQWAPVSP